MTICLVVAVLVIAAGQGFGDTYFNDGATYNINYSTSHVHVDQGVPGMFTTVNLLDGGSVYKWWAYEDSRINIYGGIVVSSSLVAYDRTQVTMSGGQIWYLDAYDSSQVTMTGGTATGDLVAEGSSQVALSGGSVDGWLCAGGGSHVTMSGGSVRGLLSASNSSHVYFSGGSVGSVSAFGNSYIDFSGGSVDSDLVLDDFAILTINGSNFAIDGDVVDYGEITSILGGYYGNESARRLTGSLLSGEFIDNDFRIGNYAKIILIPEPATFLLLGLGAVMLRRK